MDSCCLVIVFRYSSQPLYRREFLASTHMRNAITSWRWKFSFGPQYGKKMFYNRSFSVGFYTRDQVRKKEKKKKKKKWKKGKSHTRDISTTFPRNNRSTIRPLILIGWKFQGYRFSKPREYLCFSIRWFGRNGSFSLVAYTNTSAGKNIF